MWTLLCGLVVVLINTKEGPYSVKKSKVIENRGESMGIGELFREKRVLSYAITSFFIKFSHYGYLLWLPYYLKSGLNSSDSRVVVILALYDIGFLIGSFITGLISDHVRSRYSTFSPTS